MDSYIFIMIVSVLIASFSQILLKKSAQQEHGPGFLKQYLNKFVILGYVLLFVSMILTMLAYATMEMKLGPVLESLGYAFVMVLSALFFKERITKKKLIGTALIIFGVIFFNLNIF
ncbi:MAG: EamA family transporter [Christensenellaceae bacterium]|jgi:small multidrug resistance pump